MHYTVFIGRFQPFHKGHYRVVQEALEQSDKLILVLGGVEKPRTPRDPLTYTERSNIILNSLTDVEKSRVIITGVHDYAYNDNRWIAEVQNKVDLSTEWTSNSHKISLIGYSKDHSSYYLKMFPSWNNIEVQPDGPVINSTDIRNAYYNLVYQGSEELLQVNKFFVTNFAREQWVGTLMNEPLLKVFDEYQFLAKHKEMWKDSPFPPTFNTVDACITMGGHILLVQRGRDIGKGLWALPGGYVNQYETLVDAMIRELREETGLKIPAPVLKGSIKNVQTADYPYRSERGRIISQVYHINLGFNPNDPIKLPKVKGSDDAMHAKWFTLAEFVNMREVMFEDHYDVIVSLLKVV